jgi:hypothetical protein
MARQTALLLSLLSNAHDSAAAASEAVGLLLSECPGTRKACNAHSTVSYAT